MIFSKLNLAELRAAEAHFDALRREKALYWDMYQRQADKVGAAAKKLQATEFLARAKAEQREKDVAYLRQQLKQYREQAEAQRQEVRHSKAVATGYQGYARRANNTIHRQKAELKTLEWERDQAKNAVSDYQNVLNDVRRLQARVKTLETENGELKKQDRAERGEFDTQAQRMYHNLRVTYETLKRGYDELRKNGCAEADVILKGYSQALHDSKLENSELASRLTALGNETSGLYTEVGRLESEKSVMDLHMATLGGENKELYIEIDRLKNQTLWQFLASKFK